MSGASAERLGVLDGLRAVAAGAVVVYHAEGLIGGGPFTAVFAGLGTQAVALFFALSAFLVARPVFAGRRRGDDATSAWRFVFRRAARILPLYWVVLFTHLVVLRHAEIGELRQLVASVTLTQNLQGPTVFVPPFVAWSLSVELWFAVAVPGLFRALDALEERCRRLDRLGVELLGIAAFALIGPIWRLALGTSDPSLGFGLWPIAFTDWFAPGLVLAAVLAELAAPRPTPWLLRLRRAVAGRLPATALAITAIGTAAVVALDLPTNFVSPSPTQYHGSHLLYGLVAAAILVGTAAATDRFRDTTNRLATDTWRRAGAASYALYLIHIPWFTLWTSVLDGAPVAVGVGLGIVSSVLTAPLAHRYVERPAQELADRLWRALDRPGLRWPTPFLLGARGLVDRPWRTVALLVVPAFAVPVLRAPGRLVADNRYELWVAPAQRLERMVTLWDTERDLGRVAEEFWPAMTVFAAGLDALSVPPWLIQRSFHGTLLALAATGAWWLARTLRPERPGAAVLSGVLYGFGPFAMAYLLPSALFIGHAAAPWFAVAMWRAMTGPRPLRPVAAAALGIVAIGNVDPPGLLFALLPAAVIWCLGWRDAGGRRRLIDIAAMAAIGVIAGSAAMLVKTGAGATALSHRLLETEPADVVARTTSVGESLRGAGFWLLRHQEDGAFLRPQTRWLITNPAVVAASLAPLLTGLAHLRRRSDTPCRVVAAITLVGLVAAVGGFAAATPWSALVTGAMEQSTTLYSFRSTHKALSIVGLGLSLLGAWGAADLRDRLMLRHPSLRVGAEMLAVVVVASATSMFWAASIYDDRTTSAPLPEHWRAAATDLDRRLADGERVLVLPAATYATYEWGDVGDDVLDAVLGRGHVVASTIPSATPETAALVLELDRVAADPTLHHTLPTLAARLGITHVLIRHDLAPPDRSSGNPSWIVDDLVDLPGVDLVGGYGPSRLQPDGRASATLELLELPVVEIPADRGVVSIAGGPEALTALDWLGDAPRPTRWVADGPTASPIVTRQIVTDTNVARDRWIVREGFRHSDIAAVDVGSTPGVPGARTTATGSVASVAGPRLADRSEASSPWAAVDGDVATVWVADDVELRIDHLPVGPHEVTILASDPTGAALEAIGVAVDDEPMRWFPPISASYRFTLEAASTLRIAAGGDGTGDVGIAEVVVGDLDLARRLVVPAPDGLGAEPVDLLFTRRSGDATPEASIRRIVDLDRPLRVSIDGVATAGATTGCHDDLLTVDGSPLPIAIDPAGAVTACDGATLDLQAGLHEILLRPDATRRVDVLRFRDTTPDAAVTPGWLRTNGQSHDPAWTARLGGTALVSVGPIDGQTAWLAPSPTAPLEATHPTTVFRSALVVSSLAALALVGVTTGTTGRLGSAPVTPPRLRSPLLPRRRVRIGLAVGAAVVFGGVAGAVVAGVMLLAARIGRHDTAPWQDPSWRVVQTLAAVTTMVLVGPSLLLGVGAEPATTDLVPRCLVVALVVRQAIVGIPAGAAAPTRVRPVDAADAADAPMGVS